MPGTADDPRVRSGRTKRERSRAALLAAAERAFSERGWLGARTEDIAKEAGVSAATMLNHFPSKHSLIGHVYRPIALPAVQKAERALAQGGDVLDMLERHVRDLARISRRHRTLTVAFVGAVQEYTVRAGGPPNPEDPHDPRILAPLPDAVIHLIAAGQEQGILRPYPPAPDIGPQITNLLLLRAMTRPRESASDTAELMLTVLFGTLRPETLVASGAAGRPFANSPAASSGSR